MGSSTGLLDSVLDPITIFASGQNQIIGIGNISIPTLIISTIGLLQDNADVILEASEYVRGHKK